MQHYLIHPTSIRIWVVNQLYYVRQVTSSQQLTIHAYYIVQTCIAIIMAQLGCYVPARRCRMTVVDRIFTRIGKLHHVISIGPLFTSMIRCQ
jgi:hypothetical protein